MKQTLQRTITALFLIVVIATGLASSIGPIALAATPINIAYAAGTDAKINGQPVLNVTAYANVATNITTVKPVRNTSGFNFAGWSEAKDTGIVKYKSGEKNVTFKGGTTLYPVWQINLAFVSGKDASINGTTNTVMNVGTYVGKGTSVPSAVPVKTGYTCIGWTDVQGGTTVKFSKGNSYKFYKPTTLYPVWEANTYKITFDGCGGTWKNGDTVQKVTYGKAFSLTPPAFTKTGYTLAGWNTKSDGSGTMYQSGQTNITVTSNITLYAIWTGTTCKITYKENGGTIGTVGSTGTTQTFTVGNSVTLAPPSFYKDGCTLLGFSTNSKATTASYQRGKAYKFNCNTILYAIWGANVTYDPNGGTITKGNKTQSFVSGISFKLEAPEMVNPKHDLLGFSTKPNATVPTYKVGEVVTLTKDTKLYAVWSSQRLGKKAIVIFPGILGSNLHDSDSNCFYKSSIVYSDYALQKLDLAKIIYSKAKFSRTASGNCLTSGYGFGDEYYYLYLELQKAFLNTEYEVLLYQYDWRQSCATTAAQFKEEVAGKYDKLVLVGHSMGGLVASSYIASLGNSAKDKVEKAFFLGTPFLGAPIAAYLKDGNEFLKEFLDIDMEEPLVTIKFTFNEVGIKIKPTVWLINKLAGVAFSALNSSYDLYPDIARIRSLVSAEKADMINVMTSFSAAETYLIQDTTKKYWYTDSNGNTQHVTNRVDSYYIVGYNRETIMGETANIILKNDLVKQNSGDGIVPEYSAGIAGKYKSKTFSIKCSHRGLVFDQKVYDFIISHIAN